MACDLCSDFRAALEKIEALIEDQCNGRPHGTDMSLLHQIHEICDRELMAADFSRSP